LVEDQGFIGEIHCLAILDHTTKCRTDLWSWGPTSWVAWVGLDPITVLSGPEILPCRSLTPL